jgi:cytochrome c-type biogenesis protein CcmH
MKALQRLLVVLAVWACGPAWAVLPDEILADPALEARARILSKELRCMVCQNQSIDDSGAPLARDLRLLVRERLTSGDSDSQVLDFLVARYGEFVLLQPRLSWHTAILWLAPPGALIAGALALLWIARGRGSKVRSTGEIKPLTPAEETRLARLMQSGDI